MSAPRIAPGGWGRTWWCSEAAGDSHSLMTFSRICSSSSGSGMPVGLFTQNNQRYPARPRPMASSVVTASRENQLMTWSGARWYLRPQIPAWQVPASTGDPARPCPLPQLNLAPDLANHIVHVCTYYKWQEPLAGWSATTVFLSRAHHPEQWAREGEGGGGG